MTPIVQPAKAPVIYVPKDTLPGGFGIWTPPQAAPPPSVPMNRAERRRLARAMRKRKPESVVGPV